jgi:hypothetical protein
MAITQISDLWVPAIWIKETRERQATFPSVFNSGVVVKGEQFDSIAAGAGTAANIPFFKDITDQTDEIQVENTGPTTDNGQNSGLQVAPILNRVTKNSATALASAVSGSDPVGSMTGQLAQRRLKQRNATLIAMLRGILGGGATANAGACQLSAMRIEAFDETGTDATPAQTMSSDLFIQAKSLLGELADELRFGALIIHPTPLAALEKADASSFKTGLASGLPWAIRTYRDVPVFISEKLSRAGTTNGSVFETLLLAPGSIAYGEKGQLGDVIDVASLQLYADKDKNNATIYDRTRFLMALAGMKWTGTPAGQSATNAELQVVTNWSLQFQTANRCGVAMIRTNA